MNDHICKEVRVRSPAATEHNLVIGGAGARVMPSAAGALCAFEKAGLKMETAGGVSGGFLVAVLLMSGLAPKTIARLSVEIVFQKLLSMRTSIGPVSSADLSPCQRAVVALAGSFRIRKTWCLV